MSESVPIGKYEDGEVANLNIKRLIVSRMLLTADSGGGKSYLLRKVIEAVSKTTQTIVIDPEGEFASLREIRDMVLIGPDGDAPAEPRSASLLCRKLMELHLSAVIDLSELDLKQRQEFVAAFCTTMIELPKSLWHRCFVFIDEAHESAPENDQAVSERPMALLSAKGRKRGFCTIAATQRLSSFSKNVAAGLKNQFLGTFSLDADIKRAAGTLGMGKDRWTEIRDLSSVEGREGEFFCFGPAFGHRGIRKMRASKVESTHPEVGQGKPSKPPAPSKKIIGVLSELKDLPQQAEEEIKTMRAAQDRIRQLERELKSKPSVGADDLEKLKASAFKSAEHQFKKTIVRLRSGIEEAMKVIAEINAKGFEAVGVDPAEVKKAVESAAQQIMKLAEQTTARRQAEFEKLKREVNQFMSKMQKLLSNEEVQVQLDVKHNEPFTVATRAERPLPKSAKVIELAEGETLPKGEIAILTACAQHPDGVTRQLLTVLTGYASSSRNTYLQRLSQRGFVVIGDRILATDAGVSVLGNDFEPLPTGDDLRKHWLKELPEGERKILAILIEKYPDEVDRRTLSEATGYAQSSRNTYLQRLGARELISTSGGPVKASDTLFS